MYSDHWIGVPLFVIVIKDDVIIINRRPAILNFCAFLRLVSCFQENFIFAKDIRKKTNKGQGDQFHYMTSFWRGRVYFRNFRNFGWNLRREVSWPRGQRSLRFFVWNFSCVIAEKGKATQKIPGVSFLRCVWPLQPLTLFSLSLLLSHLHHRQRNEEIRPGKVLDRSWVRTRVRWWFVINFLSGSSATSIDCKKCLDPRRH